MGLEDILIGGTGGHPTQIYLQKKNNGFELQHIPVPLKRTRCMKRVILL
jgi:hypothetical protein